jgi:hypothetical protein
VREYIHRAVIVEVLIEALVAKWAESLGRFGLLKISTALYEILIAMKVLEDTHRQGTLAMLALYLPMASIFPG